MKNQWGFQPPGEKPTRPLKGPVHGFAPSQTLTLGVSGGTAAREAQETPRERLSCVAPRQGLEGQPTRALGQAHPLAACGRHHLTCAGPSARLADSESTLAGESGCSAPCLPEAPPQPTYQIALGAFPRQLALPCGCPGLSFDCKRQSSARAARAPWERLWWWTTSSTPGYGIS